MKPICVLLMYLGEAREEPIQYYKSPALVKNQGRSMEFTKQPKLSGAATADIACHCVCIQQTVDSSADTVNLRTTASLRYTSVNAVTIHISECYLNIVKSNFIL